MTRTLLMIVLTLIFFQPTKAQITITNQDMPSVGSIYPVSIGQITPAIDPIPTGAGFTWDFSMLQPVSQEVDTFLSVSSTGTTYAFYFADVSFNSNRSNLAIKGGTLPTIPGLPISISDVFSFYHKSTQEFKQTGYGATINGIGVPVGFDNKDRIYNFPLDFGDTDSCFSDFEISLSGLGYYGHEQTRLSEVDGWGTLITPYGTFDVLRVRSEIEAWDTVFADTLGFGFGFTQPTTVEYKWLGSSQGIPLLQINTTVSGMTGNETVTSIRYRDNLLSGLASLLTNTGMALYPNPSQGFLFSRFELSHTMRVSLRLLSLDGRLVSVLMEDEVSSGTSVIRHRLPEGIAPGLYLIEGLVGEEPIARKLLVD